MRSGLNLAARASLLLPDFLILSEPHAAWHCVGIKSILYQGKRMSRLSIYMYRLLRIAYMAWHGEMRSGVSFAARASLGLVEEGFQVRLDGQLAV